MQAVIMAGGKGTRLATITKDIPKPMVLIENRPLLEHQIKNLKENGVNKIIIVIGYLGNVIKDYFADGTKYGIDISYYEEREPLGTAGALRELEDVLEDNFLLIFGDLFFDINFESFCEYHRTKEACITLFAHPNSHPYDSDLIIVNENNRVIGWKYKNEIRDENYKNIVNAGLYVVNKRICDLLKKIEKKKIDLEKDVIAKCLSSECVYAYRSTEYVKDLGTPERLYKVVADYHNGICAGRNLKNRQKCVFLDRDGTVNRYVGFLTSIEQMELEDYSADAISILNNSEYLCIVITNQPVVARGEVTVSELDDIHDKLFTLLGNKGAYVDDLYYCPHHPDKGFDGEISELKIKCDCRKPGIALIEKAAEKYNIDLSNSWFVGDTYVDIKTGLNAGMKTCLLRGGDTNKRDEYYCQPDVIADNLLDAVEKIFTN